MRKKVLLAAVALELLGIIIISAGIGFEIAYGADLGYMLITGGSVLVASGGVIFGKFWKQR